MYYANKSSLPSPKWRVTHHPLTQLEVGVGGRTDRNNAALLREVRVWAPARREEARPLLAPASSAAGSL